MPADTTVPRQSPNGEGHQHASQDPRARRPMGADMIEALSAAQAMGVERVFPRLTPAQIARVAAHRLSAPGPILHHVDGR